MTNSIRALSEGGHGVDVERHDDVPGMEALQALAVLGTVEKVDHGRQ